MITEQQPPHTPSDEISSRRHGPRVPGPRPLIITGIVAVLVAIVAGAIWGLTRSNVGSATTTTRAIPSATATMIPRVVYQADWSHGANGWTLPAQAQIVDGHLLLDSQTSIALQIPYVPTTRNYAIDMDFQIEGMTIGGHFGLTARNATGDLQYAAQMACTPMHEGAWTPDMGGCPGAVYVNTHAAKDPSGYFTSDYVVRGGPQTFHLEVTGDTVNFCPVDDCLVPVTSAQPLIASPHLFIEVRAVKLLITRVTVTTL